MTKTDYVGLSITLVAFAVIFSPLALSDSDPYHIQGLAKEISKNLENLDLFFGAESAGSNPFVQGENDIIIFKRISLSEMKGGVYHLVPGTSGSVVSYLN